MKTKNLNQNYEFNLNTKLNSQTLLILSDIVEDLCYDHSKKISKQTEKFEILKRALKIDSSTLEAARYYNQPEQKKWLDMVSLQTKDSLHGFTQKKSQLIAQKNAQAIDNVKKIYESNNQELIEKFKNLLQQRYEKTMQKLSLVEQKLKQIVTLKDIILQKGYSHFYTPVKDKEGFAVPSNKKSSEEKKRRSVNNDPQEPHKRIALEQQTKKEKNNNVENSDSSESSIKKVNNDYQLN